MQIGSIFEGCVTKVAAFGIFVALPDGGSGMVHISEMSERFIKDINTAASVGDTVRVKVIGVDERGRVSLSVKQAKTEEERAKEREAAARERAALSAKRAQETGIPDPYTPTVRLPKNPTGDAFEDMMNRFKTVSDEKISDLRRYTDGKRGSGKRRK